MHAHAPQLWASATGICMQRGEMGTREPAFRACCFWRHSCERLHTGAQAFGCINGPVNESAKALRQSNEGKCSHARQRGTVPKALSFCLQLFQRVLIGLRFDEPVLVEAGGLGGQGRTLFSVGRDRLCCLFSFGREGLSLLHETCSLQSRECKATAVCARARSLLRFSLTAKFAPACCALRPLRPARAQMARRAP